MKAGSVELKPLARGCTVTREPETHCDERRCITRQVPALPGLWAPYTHRDCTCNELVALRNRVVGKVPEPTKRGVALLMREARRLTCHIPDVAPMTEETFLDHYSGRNKSRYANAIDSLHRVPFNPKVDSMVKAFVKAEKFNPAGKVNPDPRMIQARSPRYNVEIGRYLKPIEHHLYRLRSRHNLPLLGKGLSMQGRGEVLQKIFTHYKSPVCVSYDGSRWDQHIAKEVLEVEHSVYKRLCRDPYFHGLLDLQLENRCVTARGWKYRTRGKRMSGDMNTALGNCLLMIIMVRAAMREIGVQHDLFDDGDDVLVIFESEHLERVQSRIPGLMLEFGQEIKVENVAYRLEDVEWCQCRPVIGPDGNYNMVADWKKVLSQSAAGVRYWHEPKTRFDMGYSVGQCLLAMYPGMPIISKYAERLCAKGQINQDVYQIDWVHKISAAGLIKKLGTLTSVEPTMETRLSFEKAFGIPPLDQIIYEQQLNDWEIEEGLEEVPLEVDGNWKWTYVPGTDPAERVCLPQPEEPIRLQQSNNATYQNRNDVPLLPEPRGGAQPKGRVDPPLR
jgi:hypothetical protein